MTLSLRTRLTVFYAAVFGVLLTAVAVVSYRVIARQLDEDATANLAELTSGLHGYLRFDGATPRLVFDANDPDQVAFVQAATRYYQIYDAGTGALLVQSAALEPSGVRFTPAEVQAFRDLPRISDLSTDYGHLRLSNSVLTQGEASTYLLQVGVSLDATDAALSRFLVLMLWTVPAGLLAAIVAGRWLAGAALAPLSRVAAAARAIDVTNLQQRLPIRGVKDELDEVAQAFNETLGRLENAVGEMRQFSAALAHELRTPLTALRGEIEMSLLNPHAGAHERLTSQLEELDRLKQLIAQILMLARAEAGEIPIAQDAVELRGLCVSLVDQLEAIAQAKGVCLECETGDPVTVSGDRAWLGRLVLNLVDNAIKFTPRSGRVTVRVRKEDRTGTIEVADTGLGIAPDVLPHVFDRFYRVDPAGSSAPTGVGIGLSLVRWIVERHQGSIDVASRVGEGTTFTVRLPLFSAAA